MSNGFSEELNALSPAAISRRLLGTIPSLRQLADLESDHIAFHPRTGSWCVKQIIGHLIEEDARDFTGRIRVMLDQGNPQLQMNDQDAVACLREDCKKKLANLLDEFMTIRTESAAFVHSLPPEALDRVGIHPKLGRISVLELLNEWVYHDLNHLSQINRNLQAALWPQLGAMQGFYR